MDCHTHQVRRGQDSRRAGVDATRVSVSRTQTSIGPDPDRRTETTV